jgi:DNA-binding NarL/FixJ family response regulator
MVRAGLAQVVASSPRMHVIGDVAVDEAAAAVVVHHPDVLVHVAGDQVPEALDLLPDLLRASRQTAVLLLTAASNPRIDARAVAGGVRGVLLLDQPPATLLKAIEKVHAGEFWLERARTAGMLQSSMHEDSDPEQVKIRSLTRRELEIVRLVGTGLRNPQIAGRLFISQATVRNHLTSILGKLDLGDRFDLAVYAYRHALVRFP